MPTLAKLGSLRIRLFANDHNPPHFHIVTPDHAAQIAIADLTVLAGEIDRQSLDKALTWARENRALLEAEWRRLND